MDAYLQAIKESAELASDEICAIFVGHENTQKGMTRTRRLFTTLNKTAMRVSDADIVALDEDNGFAVVTRLLVDEFKLFCQGELIAFSPTPAIPPQDTNSFTSIISLFHQTKELYVENFSPKKLKKSTIARTRPPESVIRDMYDKTTEYWSCIAEMVPECKRVFNKQSRDVAGDYRKKRKNHLLFRPIGQRAFSGAVHVLLERGRTIREAIKDLAALDLWIHHAKWNYILWDPVQDVMLKSHAAAETFLLRELGESARTSRRGKALDEILTMRESLK